MKPNVTLIALTLSALLHLLIFLTAPTIWDNLLKKTPPQPPEEFTVTLLPPPPPPPKEKYVDTNPNAPEIEENPDSPHFSDRSTLAAQESPPSPDDSSLTPFVEGDLEGSNPVVQDALQVSKPSPRPRPQIDRSSIGPLLNNPNSANRVGVVSIDAKFSQFGDYLARMKEAINYQWHLLVQNYDYSTSDYSGFVIVTFSITPEGEILELKILYSNTSELASMLVKDAIESLAPYSPWSQDMLLTLGKSQTITFRFLYH